MAGRQEAPVFVPASLQLLDNRFADLKHSLADTTARQEEAIEKLIESINKLDERILKLEQNFLKYAAVILTVVMGGDAAMKALGVG